MTFKWLDSLLLILNVVFIQDTYKWHSYCILFRFTKATLRPSLTDCKTLLVKTMCPYLIGYMGIQFLQTWKYLSYSVSFIACEVLCSLLHRKVLKSKTAVTPYTNSLNYKSQPLVSIFGGPTPVPFEPWPLPKEGQGGPPNLDTTSGKVKTTTTVYLNYFSKNK